MRGSKEILVIGGFLAIIIVSVLLVISRTSEDKEYFPPRSTYSPRQNGYKALYDLLVATGFDVSQYGGNEYHYPTSGCVVIGDDSAADPSAMFNMGLDNRKIKGWLEEGGTLVVLSEVEYWSMGKLIFNELDGKPTDDFFSVMEEPDWSEDDYDDADFILTTPPESLATHVGDGEEGNTGALFSEYRSGMVFQLDEQKPSIWRDVDKIEIADQYTYCDVTGTVLLSTDTNIPVLVYRKVGDGEIFLVTSPEIVANGWIDRYDNHRFALALLDRASGGEPILFDEHLNGYTDNTFNVGSLITKTTGGRLMMLFTLAVTVIFLGQAIRPAKFHPQKVLPRRQASEIVLAQASLYRRAMLSTSIASRLVDGLRRSYMQAQHMATPPSLTELAGAIEASPHIHAKVDPVLLDYLNGRESPGSPDGLFRLAKACYQVQLRLR